jgi:hypothetical protein
MDILITKNNFQTLVDIVIANPTHINMVQRASTMTTHVMMMVAQEKTRSYNERTLGNDSFPLLLKRMGAFIFVLINF